MQLNFAELFAVADLHASRVHCFVERPRYFDRQGWPLPGDQGPEWVGSATRRWAELSSNQDYVIVQQDLLYDGSTLSTVWLGLDHSWLGGPPLIFETMRFSAETDRQTWPSGRESEYHPSIPFPDPTDHDLTPTECLRYPTEEEARATHNGIIRALKKGELQ